MNPLFFGKSGRACFGIHHAAARPARSHGVVLCNPFGDEALKAHRALRVLAGRLTAARFHVLRFDYYGTGDSAGDTEAGTIAQWIADVGSAADELKDLAGLSRVSFVGLRFGGTLGLIASRPRSDVERVVMWDPIVLGSPYVAELRRAHSDYLHAELAGTNVVVRPSPDEASGFPLSRELVAEMEAIDLTRDEARTKRVTLVTSTTDPRYGALATRLREGGADVQSELVPTTINWSSDDAMSDTALVPIEAIDTIVSSLSEPKGGSEKR